MSPCDFRLIELIRQNRHLYDKNHPDFRNLEKKEITWRAIAAAQGSTAEICRRRFRSLRDRFVREKRQNKQQLLDGTATNPIWLKMMFLWDHLRPHRRFTWNTRPRNKGSELDEYASSGLEADSPNQTQAHEEEEAERLAEEEEHSLADTEEQDVERSSQVEGESISDSPATSSQEVAKSPTAVTRMYRPIKPKPDPRSNPIIVNLASKESKNFNNQSRSELDSDACEELNESFEKSRGSRGRMSMVSSKARHSSHKKENEDSPSSQLTCNDAFCMMLKDSLDQVTNPLKLSLLRIKILTILHNEVYG